MLDWSARAIVYAHSSPAFRLEDEVNLSIGGSRTLGWIGVPRACAHCELHNGVEGSTSGVLKLLQLDELSIRRKDRLDGCVAIDRSHFTNI